MTPDLKYWLAISRFSKIGPSRIRKLINYFPDMRQAFLASEDDLINAGLEQKLALEFCLARKNLSPDKEVEILNKHGIKAVSITEEEYPKLLKEIYNPPGVLFYKGELKVVDDYCLAVVGTRKITSYGKQVIPFLLDELLENGITLVSGLALGVDSLAHDSALQKGGLTAAVLGSGLDKENIYPSSNRYLAEKILEQNGVLFSEYPAGTMPLKHHFPQRNRIISGLSLGTLVIEADNLSGALITAKFALDQGREVFAVPGSILSPASRGCNKLIQEGAVPVSKASDILEALNLKNAAEFVQAKKIMPDTPMEKIIIEYLGEEALHIDELSRLSKISSQELGAALTMMEMKGKVKNLGNMVYGLTR